MPTRFAASGVQDLNMVWDLQTGNLTNRRDAIRNLKEEFTYDNLNRLTQAQVVGLQPYVFAFADNGNITAKTDAGGKYIYHPTKINAVQYIKDYTSAIPPLQQDITYTPFLRPLKITEGGNELEYTYASDYERRKGVLRKSGAIENTRLYLGDYEINTDKNGVKTTIHYLSGGEAIVVKRDNAAFEYYFPYTDHLGSIVAVTSLSGTVVAEQNFDAWGRKRNPTNWSYDNVPSVPTWLYRGYTGHEHLAEFNLINMNARLYDSVLGRMLSPDNFVQGGTQGFNRYSYANNNPLSYTDPSGNLAWFVPVIIGAIAGAYTGASIHSGSFNPSEWKSDSWKAAIIGGFIGAGLGAITSAAVGATGIKTAAGALTKAWGITTSAIQGANINMLASYVSGGNIDNIYKSGIAGALSSVYTATGGLGLAKTGIVGRHVSSMLGATLESIGQNWADGVNAFSLIRLPVGPINLTLGEGQPLLRWENNIGNIITNATGLANVAFARGKVKFDFKSLSFVYTKGFLEKFGGAWGAHSVMGPDSWTNESLSHEAHHIWQSRVLGDRFLPFYAGQGILGALIGKGFFEFADKFNYFETIPYNYSWWK